MSTARDLFLEVSRWRFGRGADAYDTLLRAAELWRADDQHFSAGLCMLEASDTAWGDPDRMLAAIRIGLSDLERVVAEQRAGSPVWIAAMHKLGQSLYRLSQLFDVDRADISTRVRELNSELAQQLLAHYKDSSQADSHLARGNRRLPIPVFPHRNRRRLASI
jgi:hypothetical protein